MKFIHRLGYYMAGLAVGLIFLAFFLKGKKFSCDYGPQARVKKALTSKPIDFNGNDSTVVKAILDLGRVDFSKSEARHEPCGHYYVSSLINEKERSVVVENCDSLIRVIRLDGN